MNTSPLTESPGGNLLADIIRSRRLAAIADITCDELYRSRFSRKSGLAIAIADAESLDNYNALRSAIR